MSGPTKEQHVAEVGRRAETGSLASANAQDYGLVHTVEQLLKCRWGQSVVVTRILREANPYATLFPADILHLTLATGNEFALFVKHVGLQQSAHPDKQWPGRESRVYEELFAAEERAVPFYFGSIWIGPPHCHDLYLEYLTGWDLRYHGLDRWYAVAQELARLHARFAVKAEQLRMCRFLLQLDSRYFQAWAARAHETVSHQSLQLAAALGRVTGRYEHVAERLASQAVTLVHNDLSPKNVVSEPAEEGGRICLVDWEMAGVGCGLLDLVHLKFDLEPADDARMVALYRAELAGSGLLPEDDRQFSRLLAACELHKTLFRIAHSAQWDTPESTLAIWVEEAGKFWASTWEAERPERNPLAPEGEQR